MLFIVYGEWRNDESSFLTLFIDFGAMAYRLFRLANLD